MLNRFYGSWVQHVRHWRGRLMAKTLAPAAVGALLALAWLILTGGWDAVDQVIRGVQGSIANLSGRAPQAQGAPATYQRPTASAPPVNPMATVEDIEVRSAGTIL